MLHINNDITIKEADEVSTVVIMDTEQYKNSVSQTIQDTIYYKRVVDYQQTKIMSKLKTRIF